MHHIGALTNKALSCHDHNLRPSEKKQRITRETVREQLKCGRSWMACQVYQRLQRQAKLEGGGEGGHLLIWPGSWCMGWSLLPTTPPFSAGSVVLAPPFPPSCSHLPFQRQPRLSCRMHIALAHWPMARPEPKLQWLLPPLPRCT